MARSIGKEKELVEMFQHLISLDYDAIAAYKEAIEHVDYPNYKTKLREFMHDHQRHVQEVSVFVQDLGEEPHKGGDVKQWLTKGRVFLGELGDDETLLRAILSNEKDMYAAYEEAYKRVMGKSTYDPTISRAYEDERRHKAWMEEAIYAIEMETQ